MNTKFEHHQELYKVSVSTGKMQVWYGWVDFDEVCCSYGQLGGKKQTQKYQALPKNEGRVNATTRFEQAEIELQAMYKAQCENKHYRITQEAAIEFVSSNKEPRKILDYKKGFKKMSKTLLTSRKFNGSRACILDGNYLSKIGKVEEVKVDHLREAIDKLNSVRPLFMDSEAYAHGLSLQRIRSALLKPVKTDKEVLNFAKHRVKELGKGLTITSYSEAVDFLGYNPNEDASKLKLHVFDVPVLGITFLERIELMKELEKVVISLGLTDTIEFEYPVETYSHEERMLKLDEIVAEGFEGYVHYEPLGLYEFGRRSDNAQKSKPRYDAEARVVGVVKDKRGNGTLECVSSDALDGVKFKCVMKVDRRDGNKYPDKSYETMTGMVGRWITFSYEELSDKGVPTKPVGELERECDSSGKPQE